MTPSQVRAELLGEHFELRRLIEETRAILRNGKDLESSDVEAVHKLASALLAHSQHEEAALRVLLPAVKNRTHPDAVMDEHHAAEHAKLVAVLNSAVETTDTFAVHARVGAVLDDLEAHMTYEEVVLLGEDLLGE